MKGTSKVIIGATLVMVVTLAIVLALVLVLLVELYCTLLLRRRQLRTTSSSSTSPTATATDTTTFSPAFNTPSSLPGQPSDRSPSPPLTSYYAQGVLQAPRNLLFPAISCKEHTVAKVSNHDCLRHNILEVLTQESNTSPQHIGLIRTSPLSTTLANSPQQTREIRVQVSNGTACNDKACAGDGVDFVYISNPIYDNDASRPSRANTPFETPDSSPSRLETADSSGDDEEVTTKPSLSSSTTYSLPVTPPLTPMKKLPSEACSVSLRDARSLGTSGSDSVSNNGISSSSSGSPCTSPSW